jgi:FkbM family methyltransferase
MTGGLEQRVSAIALDSLRRESWDVPLDYFNWGRDARHKVDNTEALPFEPTATKKQRKPQSLGQRVLRKLRAIRGRLRPKGPHDAAMSQFRTRFSEFQSTWAMMEDEPSRELFAELLVMKLLSERRARLSSFTPDFIAAYERASQDVLDSNDPLQVYTWVLKRIAMEEPTVQVYTTPVFLALHRAGRLYRYHQGDVDIGASPGDVLIEAGVGWGDTTAYFAAIVGQAPGGHVYTFDILEEGMNALAEQLRLNPAITCVTPTLRAMSDTDGARVHISKPGPGAHITSANSGRSVETITIDTFVAERGLERVDMIKMDIEGAEVPALKGATRTIARHRPKLAISVYHRWDDLLTIPALIRAIHPGYKFYLDCTTGFGGEAVLYCA